MDAEEYLQGRARLCKMYYGKCRYCPLSILNNDKGHACSSLQRLLPDDDLAIVSKWVVDNPIMTYKIDFLSKFPNAKLATNSKCPTICRMNVYGSYPNEGKDCYGVSCEECWGEELK